MATWPTSLPQTPLQEGFSEELPRVTITTPMDAGPAKVRRRFTAGVTKYTMEFDLTTAQRATFITFFETTTLGGSIKFDFPDPVTGSVTDFRFDQAKGTPQIKSLSGNIYRLTAPMEKLP